MNTDIKLHSRFQHLPAFSDKSRITICTLETEDRIPVAYGYSICSYKDNFCRKTGRDISEHRARQAFANGKDIGKVQRTNSKAVNSMRNLTAGYKGVFLVSVATVTEHNNLKQEVHA